MCWSRIVCPAVVAVGVLLGAATPALAQETPSVQPNAAAEALAKHLRAGTGTASEQDAAYLVVLAQFYQEREMAPIWLDTSGPTGRATALAGVLRTADENGLNPEDYDAAIIAALLAANATEQHAELELRLSLGLIEITSDLASGRLEPNKVNPELFVYPQEVDPAEVIRAAARAPDIVAFVASYEPAQPEYARLKAALADYRERAATDSWSTIDDGPTLKPDMVDPRVAQLRDRLNLPAAPGADPNLYDEALVEAVEAFQVLHGLEQDGKVGKNTLAALNVPIDDRIRQMVLNLERRRWMPDDRGDRYVFVNLADFELKVVDGPKTVFDTRVVVGAPYHRTPVFSEEMTYLELNPYWNVPPSISRRELLPKIKEDPNYLASHNFELLSDWSDNATVLNPQAIDWTTVSADRFTYKLRQGPGEGNALGRVKFMFPNQINVYLHDTPARTLFAKDQRSFSHGCVRVEDPETFASFVLAKQPGWSLADIKSAIGTGERQVVGLETPLPVHIAYLTAWVNKDGSMHFRRDVYGRDEILAAALLGSEA
ncbi:MAG: L,D-transpeptidase family protein [Pseudomonadota bacterium]